MKRLTKIALLFCVLILALTACGKKEPDVSVPSITENTLPPKEPTVTDVEFIFESHGDGTCDITGVIVRSMAEGDSTLRVPAIAPNGDKVINVSGLNLFERGIAPLYLLLEEDFNQIVAALEDKCENNELKWPSNDIFYIEKFRSFYTRQSLDEKTSDKATEMLLQTYPYCEWIPAVYTFASDVSAVEIEWVSEFLMDNIGYGYEARVKDYQNLLNAVRSNDQCTDEILQMLPDAPAQNEKYKITQIIFEEGIESISLHHDDNSISSNDIRECNTVSSVALPNSLKRIGMGTFAGFSALTQISIPANVTDIGHSAFYNCGSLISIEIPTGVTSISDSAFYGCSSLTSITIPASVTSIGNWAFSHCSSLTGITVESGNTVYHSAGNCLIKMASKTLVAGCKTSVIPADGSVTSIGYSAFRGCSKLTSIKIPASVTSIGIAAFSDCRRLTGITIPEGVTSIGSSAFSGCRSLTGISIPEGVTSIGNYAFSGCSSLTGISIPEGVTSIGDHAFYNCSGLTSVTFAEGSQLTSIGVAAFSDCSSLTGISIPASVTRIVKNAFYRCSTLASITIPASVTSIGSSAFFGCSSLTSIEIPTSVTSIGEYAFRNCSSLTGITVEAGNTVYHSAGNCLIETASKTLIAGCNTSVIPTDGSVTSIGEYAFRNCSSLTGITIPEGVTSIGNSAFSGCSSLTSITIPEGVTSIGEYAFRNCSSLTDVTFENTAGWYRTSSITATSGTAMDVSDPATNATYLRSTYDDYYWKRS